MPRPIAQEILTTEFWYAFRSKITYMEFSNIVTVMTPFQDSDFANYTKFKFGTVPFFHDVLDMTIEEKVDTAIMHMGTAFDRVASALLAEYDPLENYFTDREMTTNTDGDITKTGNITTTPSGFIDVEESGKFTRSSEGSDVVGQGTTYDTATYNPESDADFRNISKTVNNTKYTEESDPDNPRKRTTGYRDYEVKQEFNELNNNTDMEEKIEENRHGSSGIFSKQDLTQREIDLRLRNRVIPILVRMVVDTFTSGVYSDVDD